MKLKCGLVYIIFLFSRCEPTSDTQPNDTKKNLTEIEQYTPNQWVEKNNIKLSYGENSDFQMVFQVETDSIKKRYTLVPDIKFNFNAITQRTLQYAKSKSVSIDNFIVKFLIRFRDSKDNGNSIYTIRLKLNDIIKADTVFLMRQKNIVIVQQDDIDIINNNVNPPIIREYPKNIISKETFLEAIKKDFYFKSKNPSLIFAGVVHDPCESELYPQFVEASRCSFCGIDAFQCLNSGRVGLGFDDLQIRFCK